MDWAAMVHLVGMHLYNTSTWLSQLEMVQFFSNLKFAFHNKRFQMLLKDKLMRSKATCSFKYICHQIMLSWLCIENGGRKRRSLNGLPGYRLQGFLSHVSHTARIKLWYNIGVTKFEHTNGFDYVCTVAVYCLKVRHVSM